jgi:hypothetical protein
VKPLDSPGDARCGLHHRRALAATHARDDHDARWAAGTKVAARLRHSATMPTMNTYAETLRASSKSAWRHTNVGLELPRNASDCGSQRPILTFEQRQGSLFT